MEARDMKRAKRFSCGMLLACFVFAAEAVGGEMVEGMIVKFRPQALVESGRQVEEEALSRERYLGVDQGAQLLYRRSMSGDAFVYALDRPVRADEGRVLAARLMLLADVEYAEPDVVVRPMAIPNDPLYGLQWHLGDPAIGDFGAANLPGAWDVTTGSTEVVVGVVDTGVLNHADLRANLIGGSAAASGYDFVSDASPAASGEIGVLVGSNDGNGRDSDPTDPGDFSHAGVCDVGSEDSSWHGTHVAGSIAATGNDGRGVAGINWTTRLLMARALGVCGGLLSDVIDAIRWTAGIMVGGVANPNPARIINLSIGSDGACGPAYQDAIDDVVASSVIVVVAAGNSGGDAADSRPGNCNGVVTVAAVNRQGARAWYSDVDTDSTADDVVTLAAPGGDTRFDEQAGVLSTIDSGSTAAFNDNAHGWYQGTSMAAAQASGVVALMLAANGYLRDGPISDVPGLIREKLQSSARAFPAGSGCEGVSRCGAGILDAAVAVRAVTTPPVAQAVAISPVSASTAVQLDGSGSSDDGAITAWSWSQTAGEVVVLDDSASATPGFVAPATSQTLQFALTVTDDVGLTDTAFVSISVIGPPVAPSGLTATAVNASRIDLAWSDNSADETGFRIDRRRPGGEFTVIADLPANTTTYSDTGLATSTPYEYRVRAYSGSLESAPTETVSATTLEASSGGGGGVLDALGLALLLLASVFAKPVRQIRTECRTY